VYDIKIIFSNEAEVFLEKKARKVKNNLNLVLHLKDVYKNCYTKYEADLTFENDKDYIGNLDKISDWHERINIYLDPAVQPLLKDREEVKIGLKGSVFKHLIVENLDSKIKYGCRVVFGKDVLTSNLNINE
jgi:hypothetical protein